MVPPGYQPKGEGDCGYLEQYNQAYSGGLVSLALVHDSQCCDRCCVNIRLSIYIGDVYLMRFFDTILLQCDLYFSAIMHTDVNGRISLSFQLMYETPTNISGHFWSDAS